MTTYQQQLLLAYLGFSPGPLDGVDGVKTNAARKAFERAFGIPCGDANLQAAVAGAIAPIKKAEVVAGKVSADELAACLHSDGFYHIPKGANIQLSEHFTSREFDCRCNRPGCTVTIVHPALVDACEALRVDLSRPVTIADSGGSGYRCPAHNADPDVGGAANSLHTFGLAADLHCPGSTPDEMAALAEARANYGEVGKYTWGIHLGVFRPDGAHTRWDNR